MNAPLLCADDLLIACKFYAAATLLQSHDPHAGNAPSVTLGTLGPHPAVSEGAWAPYAAGSTEQKPAGRLVSSSVSFLVLCTSLRIERSSQTDCTYDSE